MACAAALATLDVLAEENLVARSRTLGEEALARLQAMAQRQPRIAAVRGVGLLLAIELADASGSPAADLADAVLYRCLSAGLSFKIGQGNVLVLAPPLNIEADELWRALAVVEEAIAGEGGGVSG